MPPVPADALRFTTARSGYSADVTAAPPPGCARPIIPEFVGVVIPAHNEQRHIARAVRAVRHALHHDAVAAARSWIVVVDDASADTTAWVARRALREDGEVLRGSFGSAGATRRAGFDRLLSLASPQDGFGDAWLATTDADSRVPRTWLAGHFQWWHDGFDAVAGMVEPEWARDTPPQLQRRYEEMMAALGTAHPHIYGANLGFTADSYIRAGGMPTIPTGEDHEIWAALRATGARLVSTADDPVTTSTRRRGRAPAGFASLLAALVE